MSRRVIFAVAVSLTVILATQSTGQMPPARKDAPPPMMPRLHEYLKKLGYNPDHILNPHYQKSPYDPNKPPGIQLLFDFM